MNKTTLEEFKQMFLTRQQEIVDSHAKKEEEIPIDGGDEVDLVQSALLKAMADKLSFRDKENLKKIQNALQRINDGTFGVCEECGEAISEKRLKALPQCTTCVICAELAEKHAKQYRV
jgi:DnaK suppressor protein